MRPELPRAHQKRTIERARKATVPWCAAALPSLAQALATAHPSKYLGTRIWNHAISAVTVCTHVGEVVLGVLLAVDFDDLIVFLDAAPTKFLVAWPPGHDCTHHKTLDYESHCDHAQRVLGADKKTADKNFAGLPKHDVTSQTRAARNTGGGE